MAERIRIVTYKGRYAIQRKMMGLFWVYFINLVDSVVTYSSLEKAEKAVEEYLRTEGAGKGKVIKTY